MRSLVQGYWVCSLLSILAGCASIAPPFDQMKTANVVAYRLQNWEPPASATAAPGTAAPGQIPGLPPQIQQWIQQGAQGLQQLIPPGLLPPGLIPSPGATAQTAPPQPQDQTVPRFPPDSTPNFRILSQTQVIDEGLRERLGEILGKESNFQAAHDGCMYAELGLSFQTPPQLPNNVLISFSCGQVQARNFAWPHPYAGLKDGTVKELREVISQIFPPGA